MRLSPLFRGLLLLVLLITSSWVVFFYWNTDILDEIRRLPTYVMVLCLVYVIAQILKRLISKSRFWWDWLYYIGLAAAMLPTFMADSDNASMFHLLTDFGTPFLVLPVLFDFYQLFKNQK